MSINPEFMEKENIKITVVIPVYNVSSYIKKGLESVCSQSLKEIEIICINDGSTDNSLSILEEFYEKDNRIHIICQENHGAGPARNEGIKAAKGEYIAFFDPDDWYPATDTLEKLYTAAKKSEALICGGALQALSNGKEVTEYLYHEYSLFHEEKMMDYRDYQFDHGYQRFIFKRQFLIDNQIIFPPYYRYQDPPFFVKAMLCAKKFYALKEQTYSYQINSGSTFNIKKTNDFLRGIRDVLLMAEQEDMKTLFGITLHRMEITLFEPILSNFTVENREMISILYEIDDITLRYTGSHCFVLKKMHEFLEYGKTRCKRNQRIRRYFDLFNHPLLFAKKLIKKLFY